MSNLIPILIIAFNRPNLLQELIDNLKTLEPKIIRVFIDGPRPNNTKDSKNIEECVKIAKSINWTTNLKIVIEKDNLGIRKSIPKAVTQVLKEFEQVIVIEDDLIPAGEAINFLIWALETFKFDNQVAHISGYNWVPLGNIDDSKVIARKTHYIESFIWATWRRSWIMYRDDITETKSLIRTLKLVFNKNKSFLSSLVWIMEFYNARNSHISTWAYRWQYAIWKNNLTCIAPNRNLSKYVGKQNGTHNRLMTLSDEVKISPIMHLMKNKSMIRYDKRAEKYVTKYVNRGNFKSFLQILIITTAFIIKNNFIQLSRKEISQNEGI
jgi:hypothetical protein